MGGGPVVHRHRCIPKCDVGEFSLIVDYYYIGSDDDIFMMSSYLIGGEPDNGSLNK